MGGTIVKDIWSESDEGGEVKMAVVQTVSCFFVHYKGGLSARLRISSHPVFLVVRRNNPHFSSTKKL